MAEQSAIPEQVAASADAAVSPDAGIGDAVVWALLDAVPDGLIVVDERGRMRLVNRRMEELFGYGRGDLFGLPVETLLPERARDAHVGHRAGFAASPRVRSMGTGLHLQGRRRDGTEFPVDISLSPLSTESRSWVIATVRDGTDRHAAEAERRSAAVTDEDFRIARDLGDTVVRGLFGAGLRLQALQPRAGAAQDDIRHVIDDIDRTIREIRDAIFGLRPPMGPTPEPD